MAYIREKKINKGKYAYLVENTYTPKGPRQKVKKYLGRIYFIESKSEINQTLSNDCFHNLILNTLTNFGFKENGSKYLFKNLIFEPKNLTLKRNNGKEIVISTNKGHLSSFTLQRIQNFKKTKDFNKDAYLLAKYFLEAGLQVSKEDFIEFYQNL